MMQSLDTALHLTCETYSSGSQLREFPRYSRHYVGAMYCWLLKIPHSRYEKFKANSNALGFHQALVLSFNDSSEAEAALKEQIADFLSRFSYDHGRLAERIVESERAGPEQESAFKHVFEMFDRNVGSSQDRKIWEVCCRALCALPESTNDLDVG